MEEKTIPILQLRIKNRKPTRSESRKAIREYNHFINEVEPIELEFCERIFIENEPDYKALYNEFLLRLNKLVDYLNNKKYKLIEVDSYFFEKNYKPLEVV